jgi:hypothetical protein
MNSHPQLDQQEVCEVAIEGLKERSSLVLNNERPLKHILAPYKISSRSKTYNSDIGNFIV